LISFVVFFNAILKIFKNYYVSKNNIPSTSGKKKNGRRHPDHSSGIAQSTGSNRIGAPLYLPEDGRRYNLRNVVIFKALKS
jgi:hypothetical protein